MKEARSFFVGSRLRFTVPGDRQSRFERRIAQAHKPRKEDEPRGTIVLRVEKAIPAVITVGDAHYRSRRPDRVYFDPEGRCYFSITEDGQIVLFSVEAVGAYWLIFRDDLVRYGCVISGADVRRVRSGVFRRNRKDLLRTPLGIANAVNKYGKELDADARNELAEHPDWFLPEEREMIEQYLATRA